ncbi:BCL2/adenovirus E1B 19 kDa protein-interacting protein 3-like [Physella acuta]|uniref:BCL2/adenovirus E1B 19 kDa protein-interacting protein 3-like n=1 Tax=Physella acuta TaxID=109671 RepID=UPI0027DEA859|nr:BCL2/adenovirus E1B 19 kDa protein-interacting protein 3-like [Physella acuta]
MASTQRPDRGDDLNDSWVELHYAQQQSTQGYSNMNPEVCYGSSMEKLLIDAQRESRTPSRPNSKENSYRGSPKSPASPNTEWSSEEWRTKQDPGTDWIWDWSSRPELQQSFETMSEKFRHPGSKYSRTPLSVRNTQVMKKTRIFSWANLPTLILTHACTFFLGAAAVFIYFKKYCNFASIAQVALD